jgi:hypothetical protein
MKIVFHLLSSGEEVFNEDFFVMQNDVYCNNYETRESQSACVGFEDFIVKMPHIGWGVMGVW